MMTKKRVKFRVEFDLPAGASSEDARAYIIDAVSSMKGCYRPPGAYEDGDPGDPMFYFNGDVKVTRMIAPRTKARIFKQ